MEKIEKISTNQLMSMFIAVSYLQEQTIFNIESLKNYICAFAFYDDNDAVISQIDSIINEMLENKIISKLPNSDNLYRISNRVPFKEIIDTNGEYLDGMTKFFYNYYDCTVSNVKMISEQSEAYTKQKK